MSHVLMRHKVHGGEAKIAVSAVDHARTRGWELVKPSRKKVPDVRPDRPAPEPDSPEQEPDTSGRNEQE